MNQKTTKLTTGAMFTAIFAIMLLIDRQTGNMFQEFIMFLLPIPMVGYSSKYGLKSSLPVLASMTLISVLVSTPTGIFYAFTEAIIGMVLGSGVYAKKDMTKVMFLVMILSAAANVLNTIVLASLFGYDLATEIREMQTIMTEAFSKGNLPPEAMTAVNNVLDENFLLRLMVISMTLMGMIQGFVIYELSLLILRRLRFYVPKPKSVYTIYPPLWSGIVGLILMVMYMACFYNTSLPENTKQTLEAIGLCGYLYLVILGFLGGMLLLRRYLTNSKIVRVFVSIIIFFVAPMVVMIIGFFYTIPKYHDLLMEDPEEARKKAAQMQQASAPKKNLRSHLYVNKETDEQDHK